MDFKDFQTRAMMSGGDPVLAWRNGRSCLVDASVLLAERMLLHESGRFEMTPDWLQTQLGAIVRATSLIASSAGLDLEHSVADALARAAAAAASAIARAAAAEHAAAGVDRPADRGATG